MAKKKQDIPDEDTPKVPIIHKRTYRDIAKAGDLRVATGNEDDGEPIEEVEEKVEEEKPEIKEEVKEEIKSEKTPEEIISETAEKTKKEVLETIEEKEKLQKEELDSKKKEEVINDELTPIWEKEKREPKNYQEIMAEDRRIAKLEATMEFDKRMAERDQKAEETRKAEETKKTEEETKKTEYQKNIEKQLTDEFAELRSIGKLPEVKDDKDPNDEGKLAFEEFVKFGTETNNKRLAEGKMPLMPMALMNYYTPKATQPAGADAPIIGNESADEEADFEIPYAVRHRLSPREIVKYIQNHFGKKGA